MAPIDFYYVPRSTMCNTIIMVAKAVGAEMNLILTELQNGEHLTPEFLKINPQHTIPTIHDNGFPLWETRAIITYLVDKYAADDSLYPKDAQKRAIVNQRLYFDLGTLNKAFADYFYPLFRKEPADPEKFKAIEKAFEFLDIFLEGNDFLAGDFLSVADFMTATTVYAFTLLDTDMAKYKNVKRWLVSMDKHLPLFDETKKNLEALKALFK